MQRRAGGVGAENDELHLDVGRRGKRTRAKEAAGVAGADGEQPLSEQSVTQPSAGAMPPTVEYVVHRDRLGAAILHANLKVVLQVGSDSRHVGDDVYPERLEQRRRSEPGQLQELRRVERAAGDNDLRVGVRNAGRIAAAVFDAGGAASRKEDPARQRVRYDGEIGPAARLAQIADRGRAATPMARGQLEITGAFLRGAVEIVVARKSRLLRGCDESLAQRVRFAHVGNRKRPAHPMQRILAARLVLGAAEVGQHILEAPAGIAELPPMIEVGRLAADVKQAIDRARASQHFPPRLDDAPIVELGLRLRAIEPIDLAVGEQLAVAERDVNPDVAIMPARLQQQNAMTARGGQTIGEHAARASGADDDIVEGLRVRLHRLASRPNSRVSTSKLQWIKPRDHKLPVNLAAINGSAELMGR